MVTEVGSRTYELRGLSTDKKPTKDIGNGSIFIEMDTVRVYMFNKEKCQWVRIDSDDK